MSPLRGEPERSTRSNQSGSPGRGRPAVSVLMSDLRARFGRGEPARVEEYVARHPELAGDAEAILDLIYLEVMLREEHGESPRPEEYRRRFPHLMGGCLFGRSGASEGLPTQGRGASRAVSPSGAGTAVRIACPS